MQGSWKRQLGLLKPPSSRVKDNDDELALFLEMRRRENERNGVLLRASNRELADSPPLGMYDDCVDS